MTAPDAETATPPDGDARGRGQGRHHRLLRATLVLLALVASLVVGVVTASTEAGFGPHEARYDVTTDATVTVDLGPLGTLQIDSPLPARLGVHVTVHEIPAGFTEVDQARTLAALSDDLQRYVQFFSAPETTIEDVARALLRDAARRAGLTFVALVAVWFGIRALLGPDRRAELVARAEPHTRELVVGTAVLALAAVGVTASGLGEPDDTVVSSAVFDGTALEGARVTGRLSGVIDTYGATALRVYRQNQEFYAEADEALARAWDRRAVATAAEEAARAGEPLVAPTTDADGTGTGAPAPSSPTATLGEPIPDATATSAESPTPEETLSDVGAVDGERTQPLETAEPLTLLVVSDLHCNVGMASLVTTLAERSGADVVLDAGDTTMNGTSVEQYCVSTFAKAVPDGVALVTSPGNHDSAETSQDYADAGATVLDGEVIDVEGMRVLGDSDPNATRVGSGTEAVDESAEEVGDRLAEAACDDEDGVDLLLIHTPAVGQAALESGCVPAQVSGHLHTRVGPLPIAAGVRYVNASTAGATTGQPTVGPLRGVAEMTVLRWDPETRQLLDSQLVQVFPDATAQVLERRTWPPREVVPSRPTPRPGAPTPA